MEISEKFLEYDERAEAIRELADVHNIGAVQIIMGKSKEKDFHKNVTCCACRKV